MQSLVLPEQAAQVRTLEQLCQSTVEERERLAAEKALTELRLSRATVLLESLKDEQVRAARLERPRRGETAEQIRGSSDATRQQHRQRYRKTCNGHQHGDVLTCTRHPGHSQERLRTGLFWRLDVLLFVVLPSASARSSMK